MCVCVYVYTGTEHKGCVVGEGNRGEQLSSRLQSEAEPGDAANVGVACKRRRSDDSPAAALPSSSALAAVDALDARVASQRRLINLETRDGMAKHSCFH